jgi:hypothetical protein
VHLQTALHFGRRGAPSPARRSSARWTRGVSSPLASAPSLASPDLASPSLPWLAADASSPPRGQALVSGDVLGQVSGDGEPPPQPRRVGADPKPLRAGSTRRARLAAVLDGRSLRRQTSATPTAAAGAPYSGERNSNIRTCCAHLLHS